MQKGVMPFPFSCSGCRKVKPIEYFCWLAAGRASGLGNFTTKPVILMEQMANPGSPGKMAAKLVCVVCVCVFDCRKNNAEV